MALLVTSHYTSNFWGGGISHRTSNFLLGRVAQFLTAVALCQSVIHCNSCLSLSVHCTSSAFLAGNFAFFSMWTKYPEFYWPLWGGGHLEFSHRNKMKPVGEGVIINL